MRRTRREKPLRTLKEIFEMNGIEYDTSSPSSYIDVVDEEGNCMRIDASFNLFDDIRPDYNMISSETINNSVNDDFKGMSNFKTDLIYRDKSVFSIKVNCSYNKSSSPNKVNIFTFRANSAA